jgi:hypothetical protein
MLPGVVLLGDSLLSQAAPAMTANLAWHHVDGPVVNHAVGGTGVLDELHLTRTRDLLDAQPPGSLVVIQFSGNCFFGPGGGCPHQPGTAEFFDAWRSALAQTVIDVRDRGHHPLLVLSPRFAATAVGGHANVVDWVRVVTLIVARDHGVPTVDWGDALHGIDGNFAQFLWYATFLGEPTWHPVRESDGIHLTNEGSNRAAAWTAHAVATHAVAKQ